MVIKIVKAGNNMVVSLPEEMLESLKLAEGEEVSVELDKEHGCIVISPSISDAEGVDTEFAKQVSSFIARYRPALNELAK